MACTRDRLWLWAHDAGSHNELYNLPGRSRITPVEAACYMGLRNVVMVRYREDSMAPTPRYIVPFKSLDRVVWSIVGAGGVTSTQETAQVLALPRHLPNMCGVILDDFFRQAPGDQTAVLSPAQLRNIRAQLDSSGRRMELWAVLYTHQFSLPVQEHLEMCDKIALWTWNASDLEGLEERLSGAEELAPSCRRILGCYMWDYGQKRRMPTKLMQKQCETGLGWLEQGRIEGMIFLASCICDLDLAAVEWTRHWISEVGDKTL